MRRIFRVLSLFAASVAFVGCDNVGRAFDPNVTPPNNPGPTSPSLIQVPPARGDMRDGRPAVRAAYPKAGGWPSSVPIVVEFSESMNQTSIVPTQTGGTDGKIVLRIQGSTQVLPTAYDFLAGGRLLVMRPVTGLTAPAGSSFEVAMLAGVRDSDGVLATTGSGEQILATFTIDDAATQSENGKILAVYPRDNSRDVSADSDVIVVFTKAANALPFANTANFQVRNAAGTTIVGVPEAPLLPNDTRVVRYRPTASTGFALGVQHELVVSAGITFGTAGTLDFGGRTPFAKFTIGGAPQPTSVTVRNPTSGFDDKINRANLATLQMNVEVPTATLAGDRVLVRVYGLDRRTQTQGDLAFLERAVSVAVDGAQTVPADFSGLLGAVANARLEDGSISFTAQIQRGTSHSGFVLGSANAAQDLVAPTLVSLGNPLGANGTDLYAEHEHLVVFGTASEQLGDVSLTVGGAPVRMYASRSNGTFLTKPVSIGRQTSSASYSLGLFDLAGNETAAPATGVVIQRGLITGDLTSGSLVVEAYDEATLRPVAGATVHIDTGAPTIPASTRVTTTTDASGRATINGLANTPQTITVITAGYDPITLYGTQVGFASLALRPSTAANSVSTLAGTATLDGTLANATAIVGSNLLDDNSVLSVRTTTPAPTVITPVAIVPNRLQVITAFGGVFEPTANPTYAFHSCNLLGTDVATPAPPTAPVAAGATVAAALTLRNRGGASNNLALMSGATAIDFAQANSLNISDITVQVRFLTALDGLRGQVLSGIGFATVTTGVVFDITGSYSTAIQDGLVDFSPLTWVTVQATDGLGGISRIRARVNPTTGGAVDVLPPQWVPIIDVPAGPFTGPPQVAVFEALDTQFVSTNFGVSALGVLDIVARDANGRQWRIIAEDTDVRGSTASDLFQFPDPGSETGLATGTWAVRASARMFSRGGRAAGDFLLADRLHYEISFARGPSVNFTVQ